jgi:dipeptidyl aminopeptidase/acylaminoacyl peptidase
LVDPARVCIVGASYGGYAALAGVTLQSGVYRCAVAVAGISDLHLFLSRTSDMAGRNARIDRYLDRFLGVSGPNDPHLEEISPASHLAAVTAPILLVHGRDDTVVPFEQSERVAEDLRKAGKNVTLVELKEEDHWLSRRATRLQMLQATVDFLQINNPPN